MYPHGLSGGSRTHGLLLPKQALCQLSYTQIETAMKASQHRWQTFTHEMLPSDTREVSAPVRQRRSSFWAGVLKPRGNYTADPLFTSGLWLSDQRHNDANHADTSGERCGKPHKAVDSPLTAASLPLTAALTLLNVGQGVGIAFGDRHTLSSFDCL